MRSRRRPACVAGAAFLRVVQRLVFGTLAPLPPAGLRRVSDRAQTSRTAGSDVRTIISAEHQQSDGQAAPAGPADWGRLVARLGGLIAISPSRNVSVLLVQVDQVALVARAYGDTLARELLLAVAGRLRAALREDDWLTTSDRDRIVIVCESTRGLGGVRALARRIRDEVLAEPVTVGRKAGDAGIVVTAAIGIATAVASGRDPERLLADADLALGEAQRATGTRIAQFAATQRDEALLQVMLPAAIHRGLARGEFLLHYQPVVNLEDDVCTGAEALVRWAHPDRGLIGPEQFIEAAESTGSIRALSAWVLREACRSAATWPRSTSRGPLGVAVNLSASQLEDPDFAKLVGATLSDTGLEPERVTLEVTERILVRDPEIAAGRLAEVRSLGVRIALDDFGTGFSCLSTLKSLPLDIIKIDRSFVAGVCVDPADHAIVKAIVALAQALHLDVIAEGVETVDQATELLRLGCFHIQGHLCGYPRPGAPHAVSWTNGRL
ncbi:MAG: GGDEF domain-containing phosphodiesterase [Actinomycetota bacterium]|nr:GGDEF domain-containing phosphodiesterase [Actinomycetota bacterium]